MEPNKVLRRISPITRYCITGGPVIASGRGAMQHFVDVFLDGKADARIGSEHFFNFKEISIRRLKKY